MRIRRIEIIPGPPSSQEPLPPAVPLLFFLKWFIYQNLYSVIFKIRGVRVHFYVGFYCYFYTTPTGDQIRELPEATAVPASEGTFFFLLQFFSGDGL